MSNKSIFLVVFIAFFVVTSVLAGTYVYRARFAPDAPAPVVSPSVSEEPQDEPAPPIGGQTDEHDCLVAAGYSWCEARQKCLRVFEEFCPDQPAGLVDEIKTASGIVLLFEGETTFNWIVSDGETAADQAVTGPVYRAEEVKWADYEKAEKFLRENYEEDTNNLADDVAGGQRGYRAGYMACIFNFRHAQTEKNAEGITEPAGDNLDVTLQCAYSNPNDAPALLLAQKIREVLAVKYEKAVSEVAVEVKKSDKTHAASSVKFARLGEFGEGGLFLAVKTDGKWKIVYDGNGSVDCIVMRQTYNFPDDILTGFCD